MKTLATKVKNLLPMLNKRGATSLFALLERAETSGRWDLVFSSAWSDKKPTEAVRLISAVLVPKLNTEELTALSRIIVAPSQDTSVRALSKVGKMHFSGEDYNFMGVSIKQGYVFKHQKVSRQKLQSAKLKQKTPSGQPSLT